MTLFFTVGATVAVVVLPTTAVGWDNTVSVPLATLGVCAAGRGGIGNRSEGISLLGALMSAMMQS